MLNAIYRLVAPRRFEIMFEDVTMDREHVIVRPTYLSICHADQRYYQGQRDARVLQEKLPMALIHEAIGKVVYDGTGTFPIGEKVIMIPNTPVEQDDVIGENYLRSSKFRASGFDGFMQEYVTMTPDRLVRVPDGIDDHIAAFTEIISVSVHALLRFDAIAHSRRDTVGIWGDGNLGYITAMLFKALYPDTKLCVFGVNPDKLADFTFVEETCQVGRIPAELQVDHAIECVGGEGAQKAIDQMIEHIRPEGTIALLGVSEYPVPIYTRMVLEKGLRLYGSSRSGRRDFLKTVEIYQKHPDILKNLANLVANVVTVSSIETAKNAFEADIRKSYGKTIIKWE